MYVLLYARVGLVLWILFERRGIYIYKNSSLTSNPQNHIYIYEKRRLRCSMLLAEFDCPEVTMCG